MNRFPIRESGQTGVNSSGIRSLGDLEHCQSLPGLANCLFSQGRWRPTTDVGGSCDRLRHWL